MNQEKKSVELIKNVLNKKKKDFDKLIEERNKIENAKKEEESFLKTTK